MKKDSQKKSAPKIESDRLMNALWWMCAAVIALVPLIFSTAVYRTFVLPKFAILLAGSSAILVMLAFVAKRGHSFRMLRSRHVAIVSLFILAVIISTVSGVEPLGSLMGSHFNQMGLLTKLCFFLCFIGVIVAVGKSGERLMSLLWVMELAGMVAAVYAVAQFFGKDPFLPSGLYTFNTPEGPVLRVTGTLGHSNYLGNFLLYTAPLGAALAFASIGRARRIAIAASSLALAAILMSGTRGAWIGLTAGAITFAALQLRRDSLKVSKRAMAIAVIVFAVSAATILIAPVSRSLLVRARSFAAEGFTGAGRTLIWRDAMRMIPRFALAGCGPEGFSKAFLDYKSDELARLSPIANNESAHNSYLDAAISHGLAGATLYAAMIVSAFTLFNASRRRAQDQRLKMVIAGLISSLAAVAAHNFFIHDQIPTGFYFFTVMALAAAASNVTKQAEEKTVSYSPARWPRWIAVAVCAAIFISSVWYAVSLTRADMALKRAVVSARAKNFDQVIANARLAAQSPDPTGAHNFLVARALLDYADSLRVKGRWDTDDADVKQKREAISTALSEAEKAVAHSLTPEASYMLLAYLARAGRDKPLMKEYAAKAISFDPKFANARLLIAEACLVEGDFEQAEREAQAALRIIPNSRKAKSLLERARLRQPERKAKG
ncbi:MAG: O-antigen ligase family protein [Acidobacteriota bacterium]